MCDLFALSTFCARREEEDDTESSEAETSEEDDEQEEEDEKDAAEDEKKDKENIEDESWRNANMYLGVSQNVRAWAKIHFIREGWLEG